jgi:hypothetical protein
MISNRYSVHFEGGYSDLFLTPNSEGGFDLLVYEYDADRIHEIAGGRQYYMSRSGASGAGFLTDMSRLIPVGSYRVDTRFFDAGIPVEVADGVRVMFPYVSHDGCPTNTYPVVILVGDDTVVYADFLNTFNDVLKKILRGEDIGACTLTRTFVRTEGWLAGENFEVAIHFANYFGRRVDLYPWAFRQELLKEFKVAGTEERMWNLFHVTPFGDGRLVRTSLIGNGLYATAVLDEDPCLEGRDLPKGWTALPQDGDLHFMYKAREDQVQVVGWTSSAECYMALVKRWCRFLGEDFLSYVQEELSYVGKYAEYEVETSKIGFFLNQEEVLQEIRQGIIRKVRGDVRWWAEQYLRNRKDSEVLQNLPDDTVVTREDSLAAGNCQPGTDAFIERHFQGMKQATVAQLRPYVENPSVLRVLLYVAERQEA